jgi:hypothetical protein
VATLVRVTVAFAITAPVESVTLPVIRPVAIWAERRETDVASTRVHTIRAMKLPSLVVFIALLSKNNCCCLALKRIYYQLFISIFLGLFVAFWAQAL